MSKPRLTICALFLCSGLAVVGYAQTPPPVSFRIVKNGEANIPNFNPIGIAGGSAVIADFDGDGKLDAAKIFAFPTQLFGNGDGTFTTGGEQPVAYLPTYSLTAGDLRRDGTTLLVAPGINGVELSGPPDPNDGYLYEESLYPYWLWWGAAAHFAVLGDFNKDGKLDMAVTFGAQPDPTQPLPFPANSVAVYLGNGDGTFGSGLFDVGAGFQTASPPYAVIPVGANPEFLAEGDFNGDGNLDLIVPNCAGGVSWPTPGYMPEYCHVDVQGDSSISVLFGNGDGTFRNGPTYLWGTNAYSIVVGDFNHDGKLDFAVSDKGGSSLGVFIGNGDGMFRAPAGYPIGLEHWNVVAGDFNSDGIPDLAACVDTEASVAILLGNGDPNGTFQPAVKFPIPYDPSSTGLPDDPYRPGPPGARSVCETIAVGDFNGDGRPDIIGFDAREEDGMVNVLLNTTPFANTTPGTNVAVQPVDTNSITSPVSLTFSDVTQIGVTSLTTIGSGGTPPPGNFQLGSPATYYKVSTTATFSGPVSICINYAGTTFNDQTNLRLFHFSGGVWTDITTSLDSTHMIICGSTTSFSPFAVAQPVYAAQVQQPINADRSSVFSASKGVVPVKFNLMAAGSATCSLPKASIALTRISGSSPGVIDENVYEMSSDNGSYYRISNCQYVYNLSAKSLGAGTYRADILIGSQVVGSGAFGLK